MTLGETEIAVSGPPGLAIGASRLLMVRPEAAIFAEAGIPGTVASVTFAGAAQHCEVVTAAGTLSLPTEANRRVMPGDAVFLRIDPALGWLLPEATA